MKAATGLVTGPRPQPELAQEAVQLALANAGLERADNVILSDRIAAADIRYVGAGDVADTATVGWLHKLMATVSPL